MSRPGLVHVAPATRFVKLRLSGWSGIQLDWLEDAHSTTATGPGRRVGGWVGGQDVGQEVFLDRESAEFRIPTP